MFDVRMRNLAIEISSRVLSHSNMLAMFPHMPQLD
jgi:hypothetical protein